ncbi:apoptosis regulator BAX-like [Panonychus citri]|uniref:apoptosis regulator BAX-like n=1 Tax=Panonychus citri TaxID=50023 RepID=UPI002306EF9E|nr:apoptosis regulator BAX-like [Panonychus citri]
MPGILAKDIEFIVHSYFREQFRAKDIQWRPAGVPVDQEREATERNSNAATRLSQTEEQSISSFIYILNKLSNDFRSSIESYNELRDKVETVVNNLDSTLEPDRLDEGGYIIFIGIADHLFTEGIKWSSILTLFVFTFELALEFYHIKNDQVIVESIAGWLINYVSARLLDWMNNHGGFNGLIEYSNQPNTTNFSDLRFWKTAALVGGILAFISISMQILHQ